MLPKTSQFFHYISNTNCPISKNQSDTLLPFNRPRGNQMRKSETRARIASASRNHLFLDIQPRTNGRILKQSIFEPKRKTVGLKKEPLVLYYTQLCIKIDSLTATDQRFVFVQSNGRSFLRLYCAENRDKTKPGSICVHLGKQQS